MSGLWRTSRRSSELPREWPALRRARRALAGDRCEAERHVADCPGLGAELDHHLDRHDHRLEALRWLSSECHAAKTQREAQEARVPRSRGREATAVEQLARARARAAEDDVDDAGRRPTRGEDPPPRPRGTGRVSTSGRIQVPGLCPSPAPEDLEGALAELAAGYASALLTLRNGGA